MIKNIRPKLNRQYLIDLLYEQADMYHKIGKDDLAISQYKNAYPSTTVSADLNT